MNDRPLKDQLNDLTRAAFTQHLFDSVANPSPLLRLFLENQPPPPPIPWRRRFLYRLGWYEVHHRVVRAWAALRGIEDE